MGCDKAFLPFGSSSLLAYQIRRFQPLFEKIYLSIPRHTQRTEDYTQRFGCPAIQDELPGLGPIGGLCACLDHIPEDILFFTSVDAPFTDPALAVTLCRHLENADPNRFYSCAIQDHHGQIQPLFTAYHKNILPDIKEQIRRKNYRLKSLFREEHTLLHKGYFPEEQFFNMNTPISYYYALQKLARQIPAAFPPDFSVKTEMENIPVISFTATSGTGKTTYLEKLLPLLKKRGLRIAVIKHDVHGFQMDKPGKDSYRLTQAGADHMILACTDQTAAIIKHTGLDPELNNLLGQIKNVDLILTEGYKLGSLKKIYLLRKGFSETPQGNLENVIAYVTDFPFQTDVPVFDLNQPELLIPFLLEQIYKNN